MTIDVHTHLFSPKYVRFVSKLAETTGAVAKAVHTTVNNPMYSRDPLFQGGVEERIAMMDQAGIDVHILSFSSPNIWHPDPIVRTDIVRVFNDSITEVVQRYPGRFLLFASVPLPFVDRAIEEAARAYDELSAVGIGVCTHFAGIPLDHPQFDPFYAFVNERKGILFFHPDGFSVPHILDDYAMEWGIGAPFDDTIAFIRLISSGLMERFPQITWIVPHLGGTIPFLIERLDFVWNLNYYEKRIPRPPSTYLRSGNLFVDTITPQRSALALAYEIFGADHFVFGSDFPYASRHDLGKGVRFLQEIGLSDLERENVLRTTITSKIGIGG